jgi:hypothetical protein
MTKNTTGKLKTSMKINKINKLAVIAMLTALGSYSASAAVITMTFEGLGDMEPINDFYNGGTGGFGSSGVNYGVSFTSDSLAIIAGDSGGTGNFTGAMAPSPDTLAFFLSGAGDTMNVAAGFDTGFSFFYTSPFFAGSVYVYSGLNGTGTLLASLSLGTTTDTSGTTGHPYDDWSPTGVTFSGTAQSAVFSGVANYIGFDNITIGSETPGGVPDAGATASLLGLGLLGLVGFSRRISK